MSEADNKVVGWQPPATIQDLYEATSGNQFSGINRPTAGARTEGKLPEGDAPVQLYSLATPNGIKVSILFEELEEAGCDFSYDAHLINIGQGDQFLSGFVDVNPNSRIPACVDQQGPEGQSINLFESGSICLYFAEKYDKFLGQTPGDKPSIMNWVFWQMGSQGPMSGQFGHFFVYAPKDKCETRDYGSARYGMEVQRLCDVLDKHLAGRKYLVGDQYSLADIMVFPWFYQMMRGYPHESGIKANEFLDVSQYRNAVAWSENIQQRPAVQRGLTVCGSKDKGAKPWLSK
ncbi:MAG: glutathione-dependent disulfide-bond oxidoreductase [Zetaproteobacteria bacterium]|nr:glutathione-dependent disulfide-bond oxidoreductase [Pseudobdellovibrionaceae bacterium]